MTSWESQGCAYCRERWIWKSDEPRFLGTSIAYQVDVLRCGRCGSYWAEGLTTPRVITEREAFDRLPGLEDK